METLTIVFEKDEKGCVMLNNPSEVCDQLFQLLMDDEELHHVAEAAFAYRVAESNAPLQLCSHVAKMAEDASLGVLPSRNDMQYSDIFPEW